MPPYDWQALAVRAISGLLDSELAAVKNEIEAKISDRAWDGMPKPIDPHHVTNGLKTLVGRGIIVSEVAPTRGGRLIPVYRVADTHRRQRAVTAAAARKRLLQARYLGWASGTKSGGTGVIGPALESVVHASLVQAAPHGYRLIRPEGGGDISQLLGAPVPIGPLDNAALLTVLDARGVHSGTDRAGHPRGLGGGTRAGRQDRAAASHDGGTDPARSRVARPAGEHGPRCTSMCRSWRPVRDLLVPGSANALP